MTLSKALKARFLVPLLILGASAILFPRYFMIQWSTAPIALSEATAENIYVINLDRTPERFTALKNQLDYYKLPYTRWSATDGYALEMRDAQGQVFTGKDVKKGKAQWGLGAHHRFHLKEGEATYHVAYFDCFGNKETLLSAGCVGCALSHLSIWQHMVHHKIPWALILEDDTHLNYGFKKKFSFHLKRLPKDWDIAYLTFRDDPEKKSLIILGNNKFRKIGQDDRMMSGAQACLLSLAGAQKLLNTLTTFYQPIDVHISEEINKGHLNAYENVMPLIDVTERPSSIGTMGRDP